ncbi:MAG: RHS repeat-associated core domain-containing protein [Ardenticatenaceae bacterium]
MSNRGFTGHKHNNLGANDLGLLYMNARYFVPAVGRFASADTIVPNPANPQSFNRFSYSYNNPLRYTDPNGHFCYDAAANEFSDGECYDAQQQQLLDYLLSLLGQRGGEYTDLHLAHDLLLRAAELINDPVAALRAVSEIVREETDDRGLGFGFEKSKFYYVQATSLRIGDTGFGDLADLILPNQVAHFIGEAYVGAFMHRATGSAALGEVLVWGNEALRLFSQPSQESIIDTALGIIANKLGSGLEAGREADMAISLAVGAIQEYDWPWSPAFIKASRLPSGASNWPLKWGAITAKLIQ